ncbi:Glycosyltransferase involved in cell wall bisynthesis [Pricia antarctica]|uniref:Glycosyltransferase involved in cell wall bisynthesis n=1 Tax=Pricia antarctica TaxID=641691 RepID=A0A1G7FK56_9FLAO|nr:glycosyltransferase [Pricia antarctica]SDE76242.1 Glycosyltransferase involved in cell wall bisynthesis [Pricia antarctica]
MQLSIVIPCYNMEHYLPECLDSLLHQNLDASDFEMIIVNDESKDDTLRIANRYADKHDNIVVLDKKNAGVGAARNSGLDIAKGKYIYFLDPDDYLAENTLPTLLALMADNNLDILTFKSKSVVQERYPFSEDIDRPIENLDIKDGIAYIASRKHKNEIWWYVINRGFMRATGIRFIEGKWMEDAILTSELFCEAQRMAHVSLDVHRYRILPTSAMRNKSPEHYNKVIYDNANAAHVYDGLIKNIPKDHPHAEGCIKRLKTRQQSFVFFLMVRLMKSDISVKKIPEMLEGFEKIDAYPLKKFLGEDYKGAGYSFLVYIFNHKPLMNPFIKMFRTFYTFVR